MDRKIIIYTLSLVFFLCSCTESHKDRIELKDALTNDYSCRLSDIADSVVCVQLETSDRILLPNRSRVLGMSEDELFMVGDDQVYVFSLKGEFKHTIGRVGRAGDEYPRMKYSYLDYNNRNVVILGFDNNIYIYGFDGVFEKKITTIDLYTDLFSVVADKNGDIVFEERSYENGITSSLVVIDSTDNLISKNLVYQDEEQIVPTYVATSYLYQLSGQVRFLDRYTNTIYSFSDQGKTSEHTLDFGKYTPSRRMLELAENLETLYNKYACLWDFYESERYLFITLMFKDNIRNIIFDKQLSDVVYAKNLRKNTRFNIGLEDDIIGNGDVWPMMILPNKNIALSSHYSDDDSQANPLVKISYLK